MDLSHQRGIRVVWRIWNGDNSRISGQGVWGEGKGGDVGILGSDQ